VAIAIRRSTVIVARIAVVQVIACIAALKFTARRSGEAVAERDMTSLRDAAVLAQ
jgi:hypothetical protein